MLAKQVSYAMW